MQKMIERLRLRFENRWQLLWVVLTLLLAISPTPVHGNWVEAVERGSIALRSGQVRTALDHIELALSTEPALASLHLLASELAFFLGDDVRSTDHINSIPVSMALDGLVCQSRRIDPTGSHDRLPDPSWERWVSECPYAYRQAKEAWLDAFKIEPQPDQVEYLSVLHTVDPDDDEIHSAYAQLLSTQDPNRAAKLLHELISQASELPDLERDLLLTIQSASGEGSLAYSLAQVGQVFARHQRWHLARIAFEYALQEDPGYVEAQAYLGLAREQTGQNGYDEIASAIDAVPDAPLPHVFLGIHYQNQGATELASRALDKAAKLDPENPAIAARLGSVYADMGDFSAATQAYLAATDISPNDVRFWLLLGRFSLDHNIDLEGIGMPAARNAISLAPNDPHGYELLGTIQFELENYPIAERSLRTALSLDPSSPSAQYIYGILKQSTGESDAARAALQAARLLDPEGTYGLMADRVLE